MNENMIMTDIEIKKIARKKATQSICKYRVSAVGFDHKGNLLGTAFNRPRFCHYGGSIHAEANLIRRYGKNLKTILICRIGDAGDLKPIDPCENCLKLAKKYDIKIISIEQ